MKKLVLLSIFFLSGCFKFNSTIHKEYEFAKTFCGSELQINGFYIYESMPSTVYCRDGRHTDIPPQ